jgi:hypothetical protein
MTPEELWQTVGQALAKARHDRKWRPIDVQRAGGPSYKTVQAIEDGEVGNVESLDLHASALSLSIVDVLHSVLTSTETPLSPEAAQIVRTFAETTVEGRMALLATAAALRAAGPRPPRLAARPPRPAIPARRPRKLR